jgi:hypothetical protein
MDFSDSNQHLEVLKACARVFIGRMCERFRLGGFKAPVPTTRFRKDIPIDELKRVVNGFYQCCYDVYEREDPVGDETPFGDYWYLTRAGYLVWYRACDEPAKTFGNASTIDQCVINFTEKLDQTEADRI